MAATEQGSPLDTLGRDALRSSLPEDEARWEDANSRLIAVVGADALKRLQAARILVVGMSGLGLEIAKNLALMGARVIAVHDEAPVEWSDLSSNFYLSAEHLGKPRAASVFEKLRELNPRIELKLLTGTLTDSMIEQFTVVVSTNQTQAQAMQTSELCHAKHIHFILTRTWGLFGFVFTDLGTRFKVTDTTGEPERTQFIEFISADGVVSSVESKLHDLEDGDVVRIADVKGMTPLNGREFVVKVKDPKRFQLLVRGDAPNALPTTLPADLPAYEDGGVWVEVKQPKLIDFKSWRESTASLPPAKVVHTLDWREAQVPSYYYTMQALLDFESHHHHAPYPGSITDAAAVLMAAKRLAGAEQAAQLNAQFIETVTRQAAGNLNAMAAFFGGLVAQEAMKASSGKFSPLHQFYFFDALEALPDTPLSPEEVAPQNSRYDGQIAVFGRKICDDIHNARYFLVGSGALGCEMLKNWAMIGLGTGPKGMVTVTDMDAIELSNLNRQFLFREKHLKQMKAQVAAQAAKEMNPEMHVQAMLTRVAPETENVYNHTFWHGLSGVCNALDNVKARIYVDERCVVFRKSLLESGTLGPKGNTQVIVPDVTESYGDSRDPPEKNPPQCLVHTFPQLIQHTLQWARELFESKFVVEPETCVRYLEKDNYVASVPPIDREKTMRTVISMLVHRQRTFDECVQWARHLFDTCFDLDIRQMLHFFPPDSKDPTTGLPFWLPPKRAPTATRFDANNSTHVGFVTAATFLRAWTLGIIPDELRPKDYHDRKAHIRNVAAAMGPAQFVPNEGAKRSIKLNENPEEKTVETVDEAEVRALEGQLPARDACRSLKLHVVEFEKDDDRNFHIDFIHFASNIRAEQYKITTVDRLQSKLIAGRIIPAIVTTTAAVTGLVCLELYKLIQGKRKAESYRNSFINLALPLVSQSEPMAAARFPGTAFTKWDRIEFDCSAGGNETLTLDAIVQHIAREFKAKVTMMSATFGAKTNLVYMSGKAEDAALLTKPLLEALAKRNVPDALAHHPLILTPLVDGDADVPPVFVWWK